MRGMMFTMAACGVGGAAYMGSDSPDYEKVIAKSPEAVYRAFSAVSPEGEIEAPASEATDGRAVSAFVGKEPNQSVRYELRIDDSPVVEVEVNFEAAEGGTRVTAELEIDQLELAQLIETNEGAAIAMIPETLFDMQFASLMDDLVRDVEAGRPIGGLGLDRAGMQWRGSASGGSDSASVRRYQAQAAQSRAAAPMVRPAPAVNPNQAARDYMNGR